jgi:uncharacterized membrane protein
MLILILGLILFLGTHLFTTRRAARRQAQERFGENGYKIAYSLLSAVGLILMVIGYGAQREAGPIPIWDPPTAFRHLALLINLPIFILLAAAYLPGRIKSAAKHPMLLAVKIWALAHLLANGDLASILLFGSLLAWGVIARIQVKRREQVEGVPDRSGPARNDILAVAFGLAIYVFMVMWGHAWLIGVPVLP